MQRQLIVYGTLCLFYSQSLVVQQDTGVISATVGDNVTLRCFISSKAVAKHLSWYRQTLGKGPELLSNIYRYGKSIPLSDKYPRFTVDSEEGMNHLNISHVQLSDSAFYFCGGSHSNKVEFGEGVFLRVKDVVLKDPGSITETESGGSVTFSCTVSNGTCEGEHSVYWFKLGTYQGTLHIHQRQPASRAGSLSQSCIYQVHGTHPSPPYVVDSCGRGVFVLLSIIRTGIVLLFLTACLLVYVRKRRPDS